jgi:D-alanyl-D-alanine carboxypeptidase
MLKNLLNHLPLVASLALFVFVVAFLITTPRVITLAESKISSSQVIPQPLPVIDGEVAGESKQPIISLQSAGIATPSVSAYGVYVIDVDLGDELFAKNSQTRLAMASTTKIMTALVAADYFKSGQVLTVPKEALVGGSSMDLFAGEQMTFRSLLYGMLLNSGNDAAYTLAYNYSGGLNNFIDQMNLKAEQMNLKNTHFQNPAGFDNFDHYTSAADMAQIAKVFTKDALLAKIVATKNTSVVSFDKSKQHLLTNLNKLLGQNGVVGIKTGTTDASGENLVTLVERDGHRVLIVLLNSKDRFGETKQIIDWIFSNYSWQVSN